MAEKSVGLIELIEHRRRFSSGGHDAQGGDVRLILSRSICSGKYMVLIGGDTAAVTAAVEAGCEGGGRLSD